jgi:hypothetical protein
LFVCFLWYTFNNPLATAKGIDGREKLRSESFLQESFKICIGPFGIDLKGEGEDVDVFLHIYIHTLPFKQKLNAENQSPQVPMIHFIANSIVLRQFHRLY